MEIQALWKKPGFGENAHTSHTARKSGERLCVIFENSWQFFSLGACYIQQIADGVCARTYRSLRMTK
jgi:hypothetical protein